MSKIGIALIAGMAIASGASAQIWNESGDAGDLPATAQVVLGSGPLTEIRGRLGPSDVDMYQIYIKDPATFRASTVGGATFDTQMWGFFLDGRGMTHNDDDNSLQSTITGQFVPAPGLYYIAISQYNRDPVDGGGLLLWQNSPFGVERQPDGPGAANPVASWVNTTSGNVDYTIFLRGANFVPAPGALALLGLGGLVAARRRR